MYILQYYNYIHGHDYNWDTIYTYADIILECICHVHVNVFKTFATCDCIFTMTGMISTFDVIRVLYSASFNNSHIGREGLNHARSLQGQNILILESEHAT